MTVKLIKCNLCKVEFEDGASVCKGCRGDIVYGPTTTEIGDARKLGFFLFAIPIFFLIYFVPLMVRNYVEIPASLGMGYWGMLFVISIGMCGSLIFNGKVHEKKAHLIRTFQREY